MSEKSDIAGIESRGAVEAAEVAANSPVEMESVKGQTQVGIITAMQNAWAKAQEAMYQFMVIQSQNQMELQEATMKYKLGLDNNKVKLAQINQVDAVNAQANLTDAESKVTRESVKALKAYMDTDYFNGHANISTSNDGSVTV